MHHLRPAEAQQQELEAYIDRGYLSVRELLTPNQIIDGNRFAGEIINNPAIAYEFNWRTPVRKQKDGIWFVEKIDPISDICPFFKELALSSELAAIARRLLGVDEVIVFKDKFILKRPGQDGYPIHQDFNWWHEYDPDSVLTIAVAFDDCDAQNGAIEFFPHQHHKPLTTTGAYGESAPEALAQLQSIETDIPSLAAGDAVVFHSLTPHCSGRNLSNRMRRIFYVSFADAALKDVAQVHYQRHWDRLREAMPIPLRERMCFI